MMDHLQKWATWREIHSQPAIWRAWGAALDVAELRAWIAAQTFDEVWFCGAGTSAYIGDIIAAAVKGTRSVPSTDLVADPVQHLDGCRPLIVNFGRSGNSAESIGTLAALDVVSPDAPRLNITCNKDGALATRASDAPTRVVLLPDATHDAGFAMTSSFSTMLLTALALFDNECDFPERMEVLADQLDTLLPALAKIPCPQRSVYLGTGPLAFAARESALKVMELSAGQIPSLWDSTLGFRHGPKAFIAGDTNITVFTGSDTPMCNYEADLVKELKVQFPAACIETVGVDGDVDFQMPFGSAWAAPLCVATAQVRGVQWSAELGLDVDDPFSGKATLSRVVADVTLYPVAS